LHTLLHECYKFRTYPAGVNSIRTKPRKGSSFFDSATISGNVKLSEDRLTATYQTTGMQWQTVRIFPSLTQGSKYRELKINSMSMNGFFIGVALKGVLDSAPANYYVGQFGQSWAYEGSGGSIYHNGQTTYYGGPYHAGDRIGIMVDLTAGKLNFHKNGVALGDVASFNIKYDTKEELFACFTFYSPGDSITIVQTSGPSIELDEEEDTKERGPKRVKMAKMKAPKGGFSF